ncbi:MAG TPA: UbiA family prenyltransferase [Patescibacteria group bacterium]|nr:UbiA family prenyltransferase [Patescibacteria group bacterium]
MNELVYGGHLLSLGASGIVWSVILLNGSDGGFPIVVLAYLISQLVYNIDHLKEEKIVSSQGNAERTSYLEKTRKKQVFALMIYVALFIAFGVLSPLPVFLLSSSIVLGGILYTLKLKKMMKEIVGLKNIYISFFWGVLSFLVPLYYFLNPLNPVFISISLFIFLRWIVNSTFFDLKDIESDKKINIKTLPVVFGFTKTINYLHLFNIFSGLALILFVYFSVLPTYTIVLLFLWIYSMFYLARAKYLTDKDLRSLSYIVVDGEYILWPFAILIGKYLFE